MHFLKKFILIALLPAFLTSCGEESGPGNIGVNIENCDYQLTTAFQRYYDPNYVDMGRPSFAFVLELKVKLTNVLEKNSIKRITATSGNYGYNFEKEYLQHAFDIFSGSYNLRLYLYEELDNLSLNWSIKLWDENNNSSNEYLLSTNLMFLPIHQNTFGWIGHNYLSFAIFEGNLSPNTSVETRLLDADGKELKVYNNLINDIVWEIDNVPEKAVYYRYILQDSFRKYYSDRMRLQNRPSANTQ